MPTALQERELLKVDATPSEVSTGEPRNDALKHRAVVVHGGARDAYQLALALSEARMLETLVTDFFWSDESRTARLLVACLPDGVVRRLRLRSASGLPRERITLCIPACAGIFLLDNAKSLPFAFRRWLTRKADSTLGKAAGRVARKSRTFLVSYSYTGFHAFTALGRPDFLFQMHPHPATMRRLLLEEIERRPESEDSLSMEWELALPQGDFDHLVAETRMASRFLVASSFTRDSLIEHGTNPDSITVVPYGVDLDRFHPAAMRCKPTGTTLQLLFVGRINQRKGLSYLLEALRQLQAEDIHLTVCGRVLDGLEEFAPFAEQVTILPSVDNAALVRAYQEADLFVLPSIAEGFGQVLLEALACGLPVLSTTRTAAPDLIEDGVQGFIVAPQRADLLAEKIVWAVGHRAELAVMGLRARIRAERFTWERFRRHAAGTVADFIRDVSTAAEKETP